MDVLGLYVPVNDPFAMGVGEGARHVDQDRSCLSASKRTTVPNELAEGRSMDVLHDERKTVFVQGLDVVDLHDVGVLELAYQPRFAQQAGERLVVGGRGGSQDLDGHRPIELAVPCQVHDGHAAATELSLDLVPVPEAPYETVEVRHSLGPTLSPARQVGAAPNESSRDERLAQGRTMHNGDRVAPKA